MILFKSSISILHYHAQQHQQAASYSYIHMDEEIKEIVDGYNRPFYGWSLLRDDLVWFWNNLGYIFDNVARERIDRKAKEDLSENSLPFSRSKGNIRISWYAFNWQGCPRPLQQIGADLIWESISWRKQYRFFWDAEWEWGGYSWE